MFVNKYKIARGTLFNTLRFVPPVVWLALCVQIHTFRKMSVVAQLANRDLCYVWRFHELLAGNWQAIM